MMHIIAFSRAATKKAPNNILAKCGEITSLDHATAFQTTATSTCCLERRAWPSAERQKDFNKGASA